MPSALHPQHRFADRSAAGRCLAARLAAWRAEHPDLPAPVVLALPRGGVPVAREIAARLSAPLDLVLVRKIGVPGQPELAAAALVEGVPPVRVENAAIIAACGVTAAELAEGAARETAEIARRRRAYLGGRPQLSVAGRTAIVVDDGIATGATMRAALIGVRARGAALVVLAVPVAPADVLSALSREVDAVFCLATPEPFHAIGLHYDAFPQLSDAEVVSSMASAAGDAAG